METIKQDTYKELEGFSERVKNNLLSGKYKTFQEFIDDIGNMEIPEGFQESEESKKLLEEMDNIKEKQKELLKQIKPLSQEAKEIRQKMRKVSINESAKYVDALNEIIKKENLLTDKYNKLEDKHTAIFREFEKMRMKTYERKLKDIYQKRS